MTPPRPGTKAAAILRALRRPAGVTAMSAFELGDPHVAATVHYLKRVGYPVTAEWKSGTTRFGASCRYKKYSVITLQK